MRKHTFLALTLLALSTALAGCGKKEVPPPTPEEATAFIDAAFEGKTQNVKAALESGMPATQNNADGFCALMAASFNGHVETMQVLLDSGADVNQTNKQGVTPLMAACGPYPAAVRLLIEKGAEVNATDGIENFTALMYAATEGLSPICDILLDAGADPSMVDVDNDTAANFARSRGFVQLADKLQALSEEKK